MSSAGPGAWAECLPGTETMGVLSLQTSGLALMSTDQHAAPGVPVDLVDVSACPLRYALAWPAAEDGGQ